MPKQVTQAAADEDKGTDRQGVGGQVPSDVGGRSDTELPSDLPTDAERGTHGSLRRELGAANDAHESDLVRQRELWRQEGVRLGLDAGQIIALALHCCIFEIGLVQLPF